MDGKQALSVAQIAHRLGVAVRGDDSVLIHGIAPLDRAGEGQISFLANSRYRDALGETGASAVIVREADLVEGAPVALITDNPYACWAHAAALFKPSRRVPAGIHASAVVDDAAEVAGSARIGAQCYIGPGARIGEHVLIEAGAIVNEDVVIGEACEIGPRVVLHHGVQLGKRVKVHPGAVIGSDGFGLAMEGDHWVNIPQLGSVRIGDDCEIGANTTIDRGAVDDTVLEEDVRLDNQIQIGHNVIIGAHTAMAGCVGVAGSARIGRYVQVGGASGIAGHLEIADKVVINSMTQVTRSIREPGVYSAGLPMSDHRSWKRNAARFRQLDDMARRLKALEKQRGQ